MTQNVVDQTTLRKRILEEMTSNYSGNLEKNFDIAKQFVRLSPEGFVEVLVKEKIAGKDQILLYLIGKMYAKEAGYVNDEYVSNNELLEHLRYPIGSLLPFLKELRDDNLVRQTKRENNAFHTVPPAKLEEILASIEKKTRKKER